MSGIEALDILAEQFARLPGIGRKTAQRLAYAVLKYSPEEIAAFTSAMTEAKEKIHRCPICQNLTDREICPICADQGRDKSVICVVEDARAVMAFEKVRSFRGVYHVLHGLISPMSGVTPDALALRELLARLEDTAVKEVIVATGATTEGEATAMYIARLLSPLGVKVTRLAHGLPFGGELEYADEITLSRALEGRRDFD
ncbi:MAG: recombination protein RecR [Ruminococcaceae bacterium]|nr:recombination protein RecR [Oscillospiraceae bacterium]